MKKNVFDTLSFVAVGIVILLGILQGDGLTGILAVLVIGAFLFLLIWSMRTTFDTETGEISCRKIFLARQIQGNVLELKINAKCYHIWQRCCHMREFETFLQEKGVQIYSA